MVNKKKTDSNTCGTCGNSNKEEYTTLEAIEALLEDNLLEFYCERLDETMCIYDGDLYLKRANCYGFSINAFNAKYKWTKKEALITIVEAIERIAAGKKVTWRYKEHFIEDVTKDTIISVDALLNGSFYSL